MRHAIHQLPSTGSAAQAAASFVRAALSRNVPSCPSAVAMSECEPGPGSWWWEWFPTPGCTCCSLPSLFPCSLSQTSASQFREAALPLSSLLSCFKAAAEFESWSFFSFLKTILFLISCPGTRPCSISPVQMAAHGISVSYLQGSDIGWTPQGFLYKHQWKREDNTYLHPSLGSSFVPTDAPAQQSDACWNLGKNYPAEPGLGACNGCPNLAGRLGCFTGRAGHQMNTKVVSASQDTNWGHEKPWGSRRKKENRASKMLAPAVAVCSRFTPRSPLIIPVEAVHALLGSSKVFMGWFLWNGCAGSSSGEVCCY